VEVRIPMVRAAWFPSVAVVLRLRFRRIEGDGVALTTRHAH
jgi:hypothetical protein